MLQLHAHRHLQHDVVACICVPYAALAAIVTRATATAVCESAFLMSVLMIVSAVPVACVYLCSSLTSSSALSPDFASSDAAALNVTSVNSDRDGNSSWTDRLPPSLRRLLGISMAIGAGCCYGLNFNPPQHLIDSGKGASSHGIDYVFSHFCGIILTSTFYMVVYSI